MWTYRPPNHDGRSHVQLRVSDLGQRGRRHLERGWEIGPEGNRGDSGVHQQEPHRAPSGDQGDLGAYLKLSPEKSEQAASIKKLRCSGHCLNLTNGDNWKKPEKPTVESDMVVGRAALVIKRNSPIRLQRRVEGLPLRPE